MYCYGGGGGGVDEMQERTERGRINKCEATGWRKWM